VSKNRGTDPGIGTFCEPPHSNRPSSLSFGHVLLNPSTAVTPILHTTNFRAILSPNLTSQPRSAGSLVFRAPQPSESLTRTCTSWSIPPWHRTARQEFFLVGIRPSPGQCAFSLLSTPVTALAQRVYKTALFVFILTGRARKPCQDLICTMVVSCLYL